MNLGILDELEHTQLRKDLPPPWIGHPPRRRDGLHLDHGAAYRSEAVAYVLLWWPTRKEEAKIPAQQTQQG